MSHAASSGGRAHECARKWTAKHAGAPIHKVWVVGKDGIVTDNFGTGDGAFILHFSRIYVFIYLFIPSDVQTSLSGRLD